MVTPRGGRDAARKDWYNSIWLARFIEAKSIVARVAPRRVEEFAASFDVLRVPPGFSQRVAPGFLTEEQVARIRETIRAIPMEQLDVSEMKAFGRFIVHNWPEFTMLQGELVDRVAELAGEPVEPSYNFLSLYTKLGICEPHLDAPSAKWTLDICIDQSEPWPIHFSQVVPWPGDAILFSGTIQWHYRDALPPGPGKHFCDLLFFHYIPRGTAELIQPKNWARLFDIPELAGMEGIDRTM